MSDDNVAIIRAGLWGDEREARLADAALDALVLRIKELVAERDDLTPNEDFFENLKAPGAEKAEADLANCRLCLTLADQDRVRAAAERDQEAQAATNFQGRFLQVEAELDRCFAQNARLREALREIRSLGGAMPDSRIIEIVDAVLAAVPAGDEQ